VLVLDRVSSGLKDAANYSRWRARRTTTRRSPPCRPTSQPLKGRLHAGIPRMFNHPRPSNCFMTSRPARRHRSLRLASMLLRQYLKYRRTQGLQGRAAEESDGDVAGIKCRLDQDRGGLRLRHPAPRKPATPVVGAENRLSTRRRSSHQLRQRVRSTRNSTISIEVDINAGRAPARRHLTRARPSPRPAPHNTRTHSRCACPPDPADRWCRWPSVNDARSTISNGAAC